MLIDLGALAPDQGFKVQGDAPNDQAGFSVSNAGDVNGDGIDDFIIGARYNDSGGTNAGAAYVIFGKALGLGPIDLGTPLTAAQGFKIQGDFDNDNAGVSVSAAGDVNRDGFDDLIVGADNNDSGGTDAGAAYVIFGRASGFGTIDLAPSSFTAAQGFKIQGDANFDDAGFSVSSAGDVNGDGFDDVIVGAYGNDSDSGNDGAAYVIFGKASGFGLIDLGTPLTAAQGFKIQGDAATDALGRGVSGAGDVNGDGFDDLIVGADRNDSGGINAGAAYVIFGKATGFGLIDLGTALDPAQGFKIQGDANYDNTGRSVSGAGDVNGDGFDDLIVGAFAHDSGGINAGAAYVIFGKASGFGLVDLGTPLTAAQGFKIQGDAANDLAGFSVSGAGDVNGDGFDDLIVGAYENDSGGSGAGAAYVIFGKASGFGLIDLGTPLTAAQGFKIQGGANDDRAGRSVSGAGDINGDGLDDLLVGAVLNDSGGTNAGAAYVIFGAASPPVVLVGTADGETLRGTGSGDRLFGQGGNDTLNALVGNDQAFGGDGDDIVNGGAGNDILEGNAGNDTVDGGTGNDNVNGGAGNDILTGGDGDDSVVGADGNDTLSGGAGTDKLKGDGGDDLYLAVSATDTVIESAGGGTDTVQTALISYTLGAEVENLSYTGAAAAVRLIGNAAANTIETGAATGSYVAGFAGADQITGGTGIDHFEGGADDDTLTGNGGNDILLGGDGDDTLTGGAGNDNLIGGAGADDVDGGDGNDNVNGGDGDDTLIGGAGNDSLVGGAGNDVLAGDEGTNILVGGAGDDFYELLTENQSTDTIIEAADGGIDKVFSNLANYTLAANIEDFAAANLFGPSINIRGNALDNVMSAAPVFAGAVVFSGFGGNDTLNGGANDDTLFGGDGNDMLSGSGGTDVLLGEAGDDQLFGDAGNDNLQGGLGADQLSGGDGADNLIGQDGNDTLNGGADNDSLSGNEGDDNVNGDGGNDLVFGNAGADTLTGGAGDDRLAGGSEDDTLDGGDGFDILNGEAGDDILEGGDGDDRLFDSAGFDRLTGGFGADDFRFTSSGNANGDIVTDFVSGVDMLNFRIFDTDAGMAGVQNPGFAFIGAAAFNTDGTAKLRFDAGQLQGDVDGNGTVDFTIAIQGEPPLPADFLL